MRVEDEEVAILQILRPFGADGAPLRGNGTKSLFAAYDHRR
jgi:hypothetical protein